MASFCPDNLHDVTRAASKSGVVVAEELRRTMGAGLTSGVLTLGQLQQLESEALRWEGTHASADVIATSIGSALRAKQQLQSGSGGADRIIADLIRMTDNHVGAEGDLIAEGSPTEVAKLHLRDAHSDRRTARFYAVGAGLASIVAASGAIWGVILANRSPQDEANWALLFPVLIAVGALLALVMMLRGTRQAMVAAREQTRIARAIVGLPSYLEPLPEPAQYFMRAKLAPVIFPRLIDDDDPTRNIQWPSDQEILRTISGYADDEDDDGTDVTGG